MYIFIFLFLLGGGKIGSFFKYILILSKASCCSFPHHKSSFFLIWIRVLPLNLDMNLLREFIFPNKYWSYFFLEGGGAWCPRLLWSCSDLSRCLSYAQQNPTNHLLVHKNYILMDSYLIHIPHPFKGLSKVA